MKIDVSLIRQDLQKLRDRVTETEARISHLEDELPPLQVHTERLQHQLNMVLAKQDDMENRLRRCNLRFVGLPEGSEGPDPPFISGEPIIQHLWKKLVFYIFCH